MGLFVSITKTVSKTISKPVKAVSKVVTKPVKAIGTTISKPVLQTLAGAKNTATTATGYVGGATSLLTKGGSALAGATSPGGLLSGFLPSTETMVKIGAIAGIGLIAYKKLL